MGPASLAPSMAAAMAKHLKPPFLQRQLNASPWGDYASLLYHAYLIDHANPYCFLHRIQCLHNLRPSCPSLTEQIMACGPKPWRPIWCLLPFGDTLAWTFLSLLQLIMGSLIRISLSGPNMTSRPWDPWSYMLHFLSSRMCCVLRTFMKYGNILTTPMAQLCQPVSTKILKKLSTYVLMPISTPVPKWTKWPLASSTSLLTPSLSPIKFRL